MGAEYLGVEKAAICSGEHGTANEEYGSLQSACKVGKACEGIPPTAFCCKANDCKVE